jgi:Tfp pilus assembly protein PilF
MVRLALALFALTLAACASRPPLPPKALELNTQGAAALAAGDLPTAEARLAVAIEYNPRFTEAWVNLGLVELARGNLEAADRDLRKAEHLNPDLPTPHHGLGLVAEKRGAPREAEKHYREALKVDPGFAPARVNLGRLLFARGAVEEAREQFLRLTQVAPEAAEGWLGLIECTLRLGREDEADRLLSGAIERFGDTPGTALLSARQALRRGDAAGAAIQLMALTRSADRARAGAAWAWLGVARLELGDAPGAEQAAREALAVDGGDRVAAFVLRKVAK